MPENLPAGGGTFVSASVVQSVGKVDGIFGQKTRQALILFQDQHGIEKTGLGDEATLKAIGDALADPQTGPTPHRDKALAGAYK